MNTKSAFKRIAIVDDDPVVRILVAEYLGSFGHQVVAFADGASCIKELTSRLPDLMLLDMQMPEMNGIDVLKCIRANPDTAPLPVVMMSANADLTKMVDAEHLALSGHVLKPFEMNSLLDVVSSAIS